MSRVDIFLVFIVMKGCCIEIVVSCASIVSLRARLESSRLTRVVVHGLPLRARLLRFRLVDLHGCPASHANASDVLECGEVSIANLRGRRGGSRVRLHGCRQCLGFCKDRSSGQLIEAH